MPSPPSAPHRVRTLNLRRLTILLVALVTVGGAVHLIHARQEAWTAAALKSLGMAAARDGRPADAAEDLDRYLALVPGDVEALASYSEALHASARDGRARTRLFLLNDDLLRRDPGRHDVRRRQVEIAMSLGRYADALTHLDVLRSSNPKDGELPLLAGRCRGQLGDDAGAVAAYQDAVRLSPGLVKAYERLASLLHSRLDRPAEADAVMESLVAANPMSAAAFTARAAHRRRSGNLEEAWSDAQAALALNGDSPEVLLIAGELAWSRAEAARTGGDEESARTLEAEARSCLTRGAERHPGHAGLQRALALFEAERGLPGSGVARLRDLLRRQPGDRAAVGALAELLIDQGSAAEAESLIDGLPSTDPSVRGLRHYLLGRLHAQRGEWTKAAGELEEARAESAARPDLLVTSNLHLAVCYERLGNFRREADAYCKVLEVDPQSVPARLGLGALHRRSGRLGEAMNEYRQIAHVGAVQPVLVRMLIAENLRLPELARDWREVERLIERIADRPHDPVDLALVRAEVHAVRGRRDEARAVLAAAEAANSDRPEPQLALELLQESSADPEAAAGLSLLTGSGSDATEVAAFADELLRRGRLGEAETWLNRLAALQPRGFATIRLRARLHLTSGEFAAVTPLLRGYIAAPDALPADEAVRTALTAALADELSQQVARASAVHGAADVSRELTDLAETLYRRYVEQHPTRVLLLVGFLARHGRTGEAVEVSERAWDTVRAELAAEASLAVLYAGRVPRDQMARLDGKLTRAVEQAPASIPLRMSLADLRSLQERYDEAEALYRGVLSDDAENVLALNNLAWLLALRGGDAREAQRHVTRAIEIVGATPQLLDTRACVSLALGRGGDARTDLRAALSAQPSPISLLRLAAACEMQGNAEEAEAALKQAKALGLNPPRLHPLERARYRELCARAESL